MVAMRAMVETVVILKAGEMAGGAGRFLVEPVAIGVELSLNEIFVPVDRVDF